MGRIFWLICVVFGLSQANTEPSNPSHEKNCSKPANLVELSNGKRYLFSSPTDANWAAANASCTKLGLHLATLKTQVDIDAVFKRAKEINPNYYWFISAKNFGKDRNPDHRWHDGSKLEENSELWEISTPRTWTCVALHTAYNKKLYGIDCLYSLFYICELPIQCY
ncbi:uncharacterized protein LOC132193959 [Neocloeon triangulifer]|uniref:uncharacterized protein LOC132193959 n=1 Tax=Neocloeon triangulifer TaxID=2078957 RepID=UPI00286ED22B|nr:uncharacterized protein LOC132193959 [Neocloeon triangulifer]